ncbi:hypothetical protein [Roseivirga sp. E12]|uniref:hypothetical protein n=1 Tax=Roseivirga sp. E12 TaxID=2819237 RepID=UPI001ABC553C|nr:hypothetical protein [Roseivirga sp. E12]MBO3698067.1 hypothetical protein [Roseivirga sp. E12]
MRKFLPIVAFFILSIASCTTYVDPYEPNSTSVFIGRFELENGYLTKKQSALFELNTEAVQDSIPFYVQTSQRGDSLFQTLTHIVDGRELVSAYSLPEQLGPGQISNTEDFDYRHEIFFYNDEDYRTPTRPDIESLQLFGEPIGDFSYNFLWRGMSDVFEFRKFMSSENAKVGIAQIRPYSDSDEDSGSTILLIVYTHN